MVAKSDTYIIALVNTNIEHFWRQDILIFNNEKILKRFF